jgi:hypothetical protein
MTQTSWADLPTAVRAAIVVLGAVQIGVEAAALIVLARTPAERIRLGKKWPWVLIILFVNLIGAVVFLAVGRTPEVAAKEPGAGAAGETMARAAEMLYGSGEASDDD